MSEETTVLYLETDDEVTSVARRLRGAEAGRVVLVAPGRSRATSSVVALRLLAGVAEDVDRRVAVVGDALTRSLAAEAGIEAYGSVEDARIARQLPAGPQARHASIHVVRDNAPDGTQTVVLATTPAQGATQADTETRAVPVVARPRAPRRGRIADDGPARRAIPMAVLLGGLAALVIGAGVLGAAVLPAATITIRPISQPLGPVDYEVGIEDPMRLQGSVEATVPVTATGTYPIQLAATGAVHFLNFNSGDVAVDAGTLVAAGEQAYETTEDVVVPAGSLTPDGRIRAGEAPTPVVAAAAGPDANVPADAIDTILNQNVAARLRGFGNNPERLVFNPEAMAGGVDDTGPEITQQDVDTARADLVKALDAAVADALDTTGDAIFADMDEPPAPVIEGLDGLVGTRDVESADLRGTLAYDRLTVDRDDVVALATEHLVSDGAVLPAGHELLPSATRVTPGEARREGDALLVAVSVRGASTPAIDRDDVVARVQGRSAREARAALASLGEATVDLWPGWVSAVPALDWRIEVTVAAP